MILQNFIQNKVDYKKPKYKTHPVIHKRAKSTGTMRKYPGHFPMNTPNLKNDLLSVLSTQETPQVICN